MLTAKDMNACANNFRKLGSVIAEAAENGETSINLDYNEMLGYGLTRDLIDILKKLEYTVCVKSKKIELSWGRDTDEKCTDFEYLKCARKMYDIAKPMKDINDKILKAAYVGKFRVVVPWVDMFGSIPARFVNNLESNGFIVHNGVKCKIITWGENES